MVTQSYFQPFLNPPKSSSQTSHKLLFFSLSIAALFCLAYLGLIIFQSHFSYNSINTLSLCDKSHDHPSCLASISEVIITTFNPDHDHLYLHHRSNGPDLLGKILEGHVAHINNAIEATKDKMKGNEERGGGAMAVCLELMDLSRDRVADSIKVLGVKSKEKDVSAWLSAVLTNYVTCLDMVQEYPHLMGLRPTVEVLISRARAFLAVHAKLSGGNGSGSGGVRNFFEGSRSRRMYPSWLRPSDQKLLETSGRDVKADVTVAKDGSGNFTTVGEAVAAAPDKRGERFVIYVKEGVYDEIVEVPKKKKNVMIVGDGMDLTIITGNLNVVDNPDIGTFRTPTLAAVGDGFILKDVCIQNTAGPEKHQAVALRVGSDKSVIYRCKIEAYQDTLYAHSLRQFYRGCSIWGTVDFIFGNAAVVFQNCELVARRPMDNQKNMVTAQGRTDPNQDTGTVIQYCDIVPSPDLIPVQPQFPTYLGRPWKLFSRTVVMQSFIGDHIDPNGWFKWDEESPLDFVYYGEYRNYGPGADTSQRVNWTSYHVITDSEIARQFTVAEFIQGQEWLDDTDVEYEAGLEISKRENI
ncbi:hypothetical protein Cgig2_029687 [Carnegiea gigantea]|uniref:Pectinesterase n=1 Tax=Carnegiea gigantea TaxID=171969 RepID=A0A9Q1KIC2_9CARY|nr:hypothetical protein Cgig2_029687 [Carnegiea gigantea]